MSIFDLSISLDFFEMASDHRIVKITGRRKTFEIEAQNESQQQEIFETLFSVAMHDESVNEKLDLMIKLSKMSIF